MKYRFVECIFIDQKRTFSIKGSLLDLLFIIPFASFFQEFTKVIEDRKPAHEYIEETLTVLIKSSDDSNARLLQNTFDEISSLWKEVTTLSSKQTTKLENALKMAEKFDSLVTELEFWLTRIDGSISLFEGVSTILENIEKQKQQFKVRLPFQENVF